MHLRLLFSAHVAPTTLLLLLLLCTLKTTTLDRQTIGANAEQDFNNVTPELPKSEREIEREPGAGTTPLPGGEADAQDGRLKRPERVTVVAPKYLRPQSDYHVLVNLANSEVPATIDLQLTGALDSNREQTEAKSVLANSGETQTIKFSVGDWTPGEFTLSVLAQAVDRSWNFTQETELVYQPKSFSGFIQTDKAIYKPGQLVQFRAVFLAQTLVPLVLKDEINVTVNDPKRNIIKQWRRLSNWRGLLSLDMQLSDDPMLGDWTIKVEARNQEFAKQFQVAEYILPTYQVEIQLPKYATYNKSNVVATVRASYTYGKPVKGHVTLTVQPLVRFSLLDTRPLQQAQYRARLEQGGSADINVDIVKDLKLESDLFEREIEFFALVEEDLTGRKYNKTETIKVHDKAIKIERINEDQTYKPGLSHLLQLKVAYQDDTPVEDGGPELELRLSSLGQSLGPAGQTGIRLRPVGGIVEHLIEVPKKIAAPGSSKDDQRLVVPNYIDLQANYRGQLHYLSPIMAYSSESQQYMQITLPQLQARSGTRLQPREPRRRPALNVNDELKVSVQATEPMQQVTCQGLARGDIIWALSRDAKNQSEFQFDVQVDQRWAPEARILCFYIRPEGKEIIADSASVQVNGLMRNSVKVSTSRDEAKPGQEVEVGVSTKPNSLVGVLGIDQSVLLLKSGNDISPKDVANELKSYGGSGASRMLGNGGPRNAEALFDMSDVVVLTNNLVYGGYGFREGRLLYMNAVVRKPILASLAPQKAAIQLDSLLLDHQLNPPEFHINKPKSDQLVIRSFFPETWLWANATTGSDGQARFKAKVPDTITSWELSAFSLNENSGFGLSGANGARVRVFRPFFIKLNLPYSIIRGETVSIQAIVFNYSKRPTQAKVTLENRNGDFQFVEAANSVAEEKRTVTGSESRLVRVPAEDGVSVSFLITPLKLGQIDIRMSAQGEFAGDALVQKLLVKPEGQTQYLNKALLISLAPAGDRQVRQAATREPTTFNKNFTIEVPANAVPGSQKVFASAVGDVMGPGLSNVDDLLRLPYGCGEQNMVNLVPNIVILNYLKSTGRLRDTQRARAVRNIETGYQRQLNYKRSDGSFSAFGPADSNGSVWLTAYVLKTLQQARDIVTIDDKVIRRAANFLARFSRADGSIEEVGMLHNKELQSLASSNSASTYLTAYSVIALLQRPLEPTGGDGAAAGEHLAPVALDEVLDKGLNYLERQLDEVGASENPYELAIITYALHLANRRQPMDRAYELLWSRAQENQDLVWWENRLKLVALNSTSTDEGVRLDEGGAASGANDEFDTTNAFEEKQKKKKLAGGGAQPPLKPIPVNTKQSAHLFVPDSLSVEMTALALLTTVRRGELDRALPIVKWLIGQQNSNGGFASTQDTVLAIEALAAFGAASNKAAQTAMNIELVYPRLPAAGADRQRQLSSATTSSAPIRRNNVDELVISPANALVNQQLRLPDNITWVQVKATGTGTAVVQVSWQYNLLVSAERPAFYLNPILDKSSNANYLQLSVCTFYKAPGGGDASNMAVMEVELPSGYVADVEALPGLRRHKDIKRVDTADGDTKVIIYLDKVTRDELCLTVPAHRTNRVSNNKPVPVSIYDYYNRQQAARIFYVPEPASSCDICGEPAECGAACSKPRPKSSGLVSLHEQRRLNSAATGSTSRKADLTAAPGGNSSGSNSTSGGFGTPASATNGTKILPLAPVLFALVSMINTLYE